MESQLNLALCSLKTTQNQVKDQSKQIKQLKSILNDQSQQIASLMAINMNHSQTTERLKSCLNDQSQQIERLTSTFNDQSQQLNDQSQQGMVQQVERLGKFLLRGAKSFELRVKLLGYVNL